jgi:dipeptide/tripeptide permease
MMKDRKVKGFIMTTMNGMVYGLFATLIIGVIIQQIGNLLGITLIASTLSLTLRSWWCCSHWLHSTNDWICCPIEKR